MSITGITISKSSLVLSQEHLAMLDTSNIGVKDLTDKYILYYKPQPLITNSAGICMLKGLLLRIRSDTIYNAYNNDFKRHDVPIQDQHQDQHQDRHQDRLQVPSRPKPVIKLKSFLDYK